MLTICQVNPTAFIVVTAAIIFWSTQSGLLTVLYN